MVVGYRMKPSLSGWRKRLVKTEYVSLPNLLAGRGVVKAVAGRGAEPQNSPKRCCRYWRTGKNNHAFDTFRELRKEADR